MGPSMSTDAETIAKAAKQAFEASQLISAEERVRALHEIRKELESSKAAILEANKVDLEEAQADVAAGRLSDSLVKRLDLGKGDKWDQMIQGLLDVANLPDPNGNVSYASELDEGLDLYRISCPIGVLLVIFEARPEVVVNIASLAIKSGNTAILKGGKESNRTTAIISYAIQTALARTSLPFTTIQPIQSRADVTSLLQLDQYIDLVIPRGSNALVRSIQHGTRIPVMGHADGICSVYLDESADEETAVRVVVDSKINYPAACNAAETLIVHESLLTTVWPSVARALLSESVTLLCDAPSLFALSAHSLSSPLLKPAPHDAYDTEHLSLTLSIITLPSIQHAITHINTHGSHHTDCIITQSEKAQSLFVRGVDSAGVYVNASTRFADGFRYGFGAEVGVSTGRMHARGPVGLEGLCTYKYVLKGKSERKGPIVGEMGSGEGKRPFVHRRIEAKTLPEDLLR